MWSAVRKYVFAGAAVAALLGAGLGPAVAAPPAKAVPAVTDPGATLTGATITFFTTSDNKDGDTNLSVLLFNAAGNQVAALGGSFGEFPDPGTKGPFSLTILVPGVTAAALDNGHYEISISPNGNDTWNFRHELDMFYSDGSQVAVPFGEVSLNQDHRTLSVPFRTTPPVLVPDIIEKPESEARAIVSAAGLRPSNSGSTSTINCALLGEVASQNPAANTSVPAGSTVRYTVYKLAKGHICE